ncbi:MAG: TIGR00282 family metallophosphoesterase [Bdellovibrionales bacterium]|nr:TIGR00282 family metallophosphoesterase [Bdellovibrionales bacterium]
MKVLFLGDIVGKPGRQAVKHILPKLIERYRPDVVIANAENSAGGTGIEPRIAEELFGYGVSVITLGNHVWQRKTVFHYLDTERARIIRPVNFPPGVPGAGVTTIDLPSGRSLAVVNAIGRVFMPQLADCPFQAMDRVLDSLPESVTAIFVDFHAEATSEKQAMGFYLAGRVSAVVGTHTHVQTADERILPRGTAYISDVGMCGPRDSILGVDPDIGLERFTQSYSKRFELAKGAREVDGVVIDIDDQSGQALAIQRVVESLL